MNATPEPRYALIAVIAGFTLWAAAFAGIYSILSVGCAFGWHTVELGGWITVQRVILIGLFMVSVAGAWVIVQCSARRVARARSPQRVFLEQAGLWAGWAALASTVITFGPVFFLSSCL